MAKPLRPKRGTTAKNDAFTGLASEITIDTEKHSIRVHDGVTAGGHEILPNCLPKNGGTMTGAIKTSVGDLIVKTNDDSYLCITGATKTTSGARLVLSGKDRSGLEGRFTLVARDANNEKSLAGSPSGTLTWDGKEVFTAAGGTLTGNLVMANNREIRANADDKDLTFYGGTQYRHGSRLTLGGINSASHGGKFRLIADNGTTECDLVGNASDGKLTWKGKELVTTAGGTIDGELYVGKYLTINTNGGDEGGELRLNPSPNYTDYGPVAIDYWKNHIRFFNGQSEHLFKLEQDTKIGYMFGQKVERIHSMGTNYIRYYGGLQICWGMASNTGTWNFPQWFSETPAVLLTPNGSGSNPGCHVDNVTTTGASIGNGSGWGMQAIAIGKWG